MADVTSTFGSLSTTESSNAPSGSTNIGTGLDENLRMIQSHQAAFRDGTGWGTLLLTSIAGTANAITATLAAAGSTTFGPTAYVTGSRFLLVPASTNSGTTTINITSPNGGSALGAKNIFSGGAACGGGELTAGVPVVIEYDGTQFNIIGGSRTGTWTPTLVGTGGGPLTYTTQVGDYWKKDRNVYVSCFVSISGGSGITGNVSIGGLPFASQTKSNYFASMAVGNYSLTLDANFTQVSALVASNSQSILLFQNGSGQVAATVPAASIGAGAFIEVSGSYIASS